MASNRSGRGNFQCGEGIAALKVEIKEQAKSRGGASSYVGAFFDNVSFFFMKLGSSDERNRGKNSDLLLLVYWKFTVCSSFPREISSECRNFFYPGGAFKRQYIHKGRLRWFRFSNALFWVTFAGGGVHGTDYHL